MQRHDDRPPVAVVLKPYHDLGLGICRHLSRRRARVVVLDPDPTAGEAFCRRLAWEGGLVSYRFASPEQRGGAAALLQDLEIVYGRVDWLISFFVSPKYPLGWLELQSEVVSEILERHVSHWLDFLRALTPLLERSTRKTMIHVSLGVGQRAEAAVAGFWDRMLCERWQGSGITALSLVTTASPNPPGVDPSPTTSRDLERLIAALDGVPGTAAPAR